MSATQTKGGVYAVKVATRSVDGGVLKRKKHIILQKQENEIQSFFDMLTLSQNEKGSFKLTKEF
ncbi:hypothetical protein [uncultured Eubacterium sp.]|uniref:hypothetical protein n=1 Tax=uncultured Eubacterium sp. TaxID=165185 RepID=UPI0025E53F71|nr:hypothetical protein [uncultured Eubacterium sp.]